MSLYTSVCSCVCVCVLRGLLLCMFLQAYCKCVCSYVCVCALLHVVTYLRVFTLRDASVTGAELIVTDGCRQAQTYILLWYTEEEVEEQEEEERCMVIKAGGPSCTPLPCLSPLHYGSLLFLSFVFWVFHTLSQNLSTSSCLC